MKITIFHNPDCGTSRNVLALIEACGYAPTVINYLKIGWTRPQLLALFGAANLTPRSALRESKSPAKELGLLEPSVSDEHILEQMLHYPVLVNRPIVSTPKGIKLCRPSELVLEILDSLPVLPFQKEDGTFLDLSAHTQPLKAVK